jgi:hypothetical protein
MDSKGASGESIMEAQTVKFDIAKGETDMIETKFKLPKHGKNLNRFILKLYVHSSGEKAAKDNLLISEEAIFYQP